MDSFYYFSLNCFFFLFDIEPLTRFGKAGHQYGHEGAGTDTHASMRHYKNALCNPRPLRFEACINQQGWLPPAALSGCGGRGKRGLTYMSFSIYFNCCRQLTNITSTSHPLTAGYPCINEAPLKRLTAHTSHLRYRSEQPRIVPSLLVQQ